MPDYAYKSYTAKKLRDKRPAIFDELINSKRNILYQAALLLLSFCCVALFNVLFADEHIRSITTCLNEYQKSNNLSTYEPINLSTFLGGTIF